MDNKESNIDNQQLENESIEKAYKELLAVCTRCKSKEDRKLIEKAYNIARTAHKEMRRKSGIPYIMHPIEVAKIVAGDIGLGTSSVVSALLHDVVEDTDYTLEDIEMHFGKKVATIIDGLTKISGVFSDPQTSMQAENFRKILLTLSDDVRVIFIKLADRLHNMRTLDALPRHKQLKIASETLFLFAPLAHRLGLYAIKTELEDLALKYEQPEVYQEIAEKIKQSEKKRVSYINKFSLPIINKLTDLNIQFNITGRPKSIYSIWKKMQVKNIPFEEIYDLFAIRIIFTPTPDVPEKTQCWNIYSIITDIYQPKPDRLRDWVSTPKANGYEALHTTVMGPEGRWVEVQIRSTRMDEIAERGFAAHWKYKGSKAEESELDKWIKKIREILENPEADALEFLDDFKMNLFSSEIYIFTPKGELKHLPKDATALDFAYDIHSEIGNKAIGAKVNHRLVPLSYKLNSGDQVEILTSEKQTPQREWLNFVMTAKAKAKIKEAFKEERRECIEKGKVMIEEKLKELGIHPNSVVFRKLLAGYGVFSKEDLYLKIGKNEANLDDLKKIIKKKSMNKFIRYWQLQISKAGHRVNQTLKLRDDKSQQQTDDISKKKLLIIDDDFDFDTFSVAKCCNPIPGDPVVGYISNNNNIIIHKTNCPNAIKLMSRFGDRIVESEWKSHKVLSFLTRIRLTGIDRLGIVSDVTSRISGQLNINMRSIYFDAHNGVFEGYIDLYIHNTDDLESLINDLKKIKGIDRVTRVENIEE